MRRLRDVYPKELVIVGVHSAKFPTEKITENIREAVMRHDIRHPVVNDVDFEIWSHYGVRAWPTIILIDPNGKVVGYHSGEIEAESVIQTVEQMIEQFEQEGNLNRQPLDFLLETSSEPERLLNYPSKLLATSDNRLFVADTGHHRILELQLDQEDFTANIVRIFGNGDAGLRDGTIAEASFHDPHGMALVETQDTHSILYVADTENHAIRAIDLNREVVRTVAGTGKKGRGSGLDSKPTDIALRSPWALAAVDNQLLIAMAGSHQIWRLCNERRLDIFAGRGAEVLLDGPVTEAGFNQPSDLALDRDCLFIADSEASAIRAIALDSKPTVSTLVGQGLFAFGDVDGMGDEVRLQHPTGLAASGGDLYIADSYNHKIKMLEPTTRRVKTLIGSGQSGYQDGPFDQAMLYEPEGIAVQNDHLFIADTNNHLIRVADLAAKQLYTLDIY